MFLRISSRDGRCGYGRPIALVDRDSGELIGSFRNAAGAMRAKVMIEQVAAFDQSLSAAELHELVSATCESRYGSRDYDRLGLPRFNMLIKVTRHALGAGRKPEGD
jgi:hypothetical protein